MTVRRTFALVCATLAIDPLAATAQTTEVRVVPERFDCECRIVLDSIAVLADHDGTHAFDDHVGMSRDFRDRFYVISGLDPSSVVVFDNAGSHLTTFGRRGEGPGEYRRPMPPVFTADHTMYLLDVGQARWNVLDPEYQWSRSAAMPRYNDRGRLWLSDCVPVWSVHVVPHGSVIHALEGEELVDRAERRRIGSLDPDLAAARQR